MPKRVDEALVEHGLAQSLEQARLWILEGRVYLGAGKVGKASDRAKPGLSLHVRGLEEAYVSRGAWKLKGALDAFNIDLHDRVCVDVGASTGGFTQVMLEAGAAHVYAVDVGFGLLDWKLRSDARVKVMEKVNARMLSPDMFATAPDFGATDVSFISLRAILPPALYVLQGAHKRFVALIKPQFEAKRELVGAGGIVRDANVSSDVALSVKAFVATLGWRMAGFCASPITGTQGNIEFLADLRVADIAQQVSDAQIRDIVSRAYDKFMK